MNSFDVECRNVSLDDESILIWRNFENGFALANHRANSKHLQILNATSDRRDHIKSAERILRHNKFAAQVSQFFACIDEIAAGFFLEFLLGLLYLQLCFADAFFSFGAL